jgi:hypothetical protein
MAEEEQKLRNMSDTADPSIPDYYVHGVDISIGQSDIVLCFGRQLEGLNGSVTTNQLARITLSHNNFIEMAGLIADFNTFLTGAYSDHLPSLEGAFRRNPDRFRELSNRLLGVSGQPEETQEE